MLSGIFAVVVVAIDFLAGVLVGALLFSSSYYLLEKDYDLYLMIVLAIAMFFSGVFLARSSVKQRAKYRPLFQSKPVQLGQDGERIIMASLRRVKIVREEGKGGEK